MPFYVLNNELSFPPVHLAEPDGLLATGGDLSPERVLLAYRSGIFPWYDQDPILWWSPDPRFVLFPDELKISPNTRQLISKNEFEFSINSSFAQVIHHCRMIERRGQHGTWITPELEQAFIKLHERGVARSAEVWKNGELAGGLYGIQLGKVFFGESMFSKIRGASRVAFTLFVKQLKEEGIVLIDCQVYTRYLESFGARMIPRKTFIQLLKKNID